MKIFINDDQTEYVINSKTLNKQVRKILTSLNCREKEISILLADDKKMRQLNKKYLFQNKSTDVLSFPQNIDEIDGIGSHLLGDVVISTTTAKRQSTQHGLSLEEEIILLLIHGILHLIGYDHERSDKEAKHMKKKTRELFCQVFPNKKLVESCDF